MKLRFFKKDDFEVEYEETGVKKTTFIDLYMPLNEVDLGKNFIISGYLRYEKDSKYVSMVNKGVVVFINGNFVKTLITNDDGYFKDYFMTKSAGEYNITAYYDGNWEYEKISSSGSITVTEPVDYKNMKSGDSDLEKLEKIVNMYQQGMLSDDEFKALKKKIIKEL